VGAGVPLGFLALAGAAFGALLLMRRRRAGAPPAGKTAGASKELVVRYSPLANAAVAGGGGDASVPESTGATAAGSPLFLNPMSRRQLLDGGSGSTARSHMKDLFSASGSPAGSAASLASGDDARRSFDVTTPKFRNLAQSFKRN
jgi:hypothetical protein